MSPLRTFVLAGLALLCGLQTFALLRAADAWLPRQIAIRLQPGEAVILGRRELAAPQAEASNIEISRTSRGDWQLRNLSAFRAPVLSYAGHDESLATTPVAGLPGFQIGAAAFALVRADDQQAEFLLDGQRWRYDGATLYRNGAAQAACPDARWPARVSALWNRAAPPALSIARALQFGGNLHCGNRLGIPGLAPDSAFMSRSGGQLRLTDTVRAPRPLAGVQAVSLGATRLSILASPASADTLLLAPARRVALFGLAETGLPPQVAWTWRPRSLWRIADAATVPATAPFSAPIASAAASPLAVAVPAHDAVADGSAQAAGAALALVMLVAAALLVWPAAKTGAPAGHVLGRLLAQARGTQHSATLAAAVCLLVAGVAAIVMQRAGHPPPPALSLGLATLALALWLAVPGRMTLATACALLLLATGLLAQLELGLGAQDTSWLRYYQKTCALLAAGSAAATVWRLSPRRPASQRATEYLLLAYAAVALLALAAQVLWGDETGVFDLQPVEMAKLALAALTAHCLALRLGWREQRGKRGLAARWLRLIAPALLFLALLAFALVQVDDYSPLVLLMLWTGATALAYAFAARNVGLAAAMAAVAIAATAGVVLLREGGPEGLARLPSAFYADRFQVWLEPQRHPHTGQQLLQGAGAIAEGGLAGADSMFGLRALGQPAGSSTAIPAVQDDFAPSFFLNRHGLLPALLLWCLQAGFVSGLLLIAAQAAKAAAGARNFRRAWQARFRCFALCGGAAFVFGHFLLSWGTNLAIFPVMGQPMSFLSAGGSHLLFFLLPLLAFSAVSAHSLEE
jgi:cell division protein FtsW